jgi:hypothetical protein
MQIVDPTITREELKALAVPLFGNLVKAVVDVRQEILAVDAELHADLEAGLLEEGSAQQDLWGINIYPNLKEEEWIEFDSMINLKPRAGNRTRGVDDAATRNRIREIVNRKVAT